ncbi:DNA replication/repair protein RecF [Aquihabitans sp. G128]|uniref:DNA replication/repair protein RecF n=1 Tax=Aquihabitans sp. G128 TaxID=2849779 RepID=UPI001C23535E|nr:DNA replication/repair protein RecF [Aquihabitans sp. G128]QXC59822.1 DNA replication/repair protein RecF [Aquihabitans sp. G128]
MHLRRLWLTDFRGYHEADVTFAPGLTAVVGPNGQGKTNLLEAVGYLATLGSFRGAPNDALIRAGADRAIVRAEGEREGRQLLLEAEISANGRNRAQLNRQPLRRARDLLGALRVTAFSPDDLTLVKGSPGDRRGYLDETLVALHPKHDQLRSDLDRILRQRGALLKQSGGRLNAEVELTLDVFDAKLTTAGEALARARQELVVDLEPILGTAYDRVARTSAEVRAIYQPPWLADGLAAALLAARKDDLRRGVSTVGPHRDELELVLSGLPARTHASQGEQRSLALALRLAAHEVVTRRTDTPPVLLLDDVFSELDPERSAALLDSLPEGQTVLSTASALPEGAVPGTVLRVREGVVTEG